jgi:thiamine-monophosphate kinase
MVTLLAARLPPPPAGEVWIGDDAAVFSAPDGSILLTTDTVVDGVHFRQDLVGLDDAGWKALTTSVSDVAAMGGRPLRAVVAATVPDAAVLDPVYAGLLAAAEECGCPVVGGDLTAGPVLVLTVAVTGHVPAGEPPAVLRSGARAGHLIWVTGPLGSSAAGLEALLIGERNGAGAAALVAAHLRPRARLAEGRAARLAGASAMIDVSDGLGIDLARLGRASGVAARLDEAPVAPGATLEQALGGGEDYELVFTAPPGVDMASAFEGAGLGAPLPIGRCAAGEPGAVFLSGRRLEATGYQHWDS